MRSVPLHYSSLVFLLARRKQNRTRLPATLPTSAIDVWQRSDRNGIRSLVRSLQQCKFDILSAKRSVSTAAVCCFLLSNVITLRLCLAPSACIHRQARRVLSVLRKHRNRSRSWARWNIWRCPDESITTKAKQTTIVWVHKGVVLHNWTSVSQHRQLTSLHIVYHQVRVTIDLLFLHCCFHCQLCSLSTALPGPHPGMFRCMLLSLLHWKAWARCWSDTKLFSRQSISLSRPGQWRSFACLEYFLSNATDPTPIRRSRSISQSFKNLFRSNSKKKAQAAKAADALGAHSFLDDNRTYLSTSTPTTKKLSFLQRRKSKQKAKQQTNLSSNSLSSFDYSRWANERGIPARQRARVTVSLPMISLSIFRRSSWVLSLSLSLSPRSSVTSKEPTNIASELVWLFVVALLRNPCWSLAWHVSLVLEWNPCAIHLCVPTLDIQWWWANHSYDDRLRFQSLYSVCVCVFVREKLRHRTKYIVYLNRLLDDLSIFCLGAFLLHIFSELIWSISLSLS